MSLGFSMSGPLFDMDALSTATRIIEDAEDETAKRGAELIRYNLGQVLKNPTGYYQSNVQASLGFRDKAITDNRVVYGPWLEGTSSRNSTTRFKGYATFRRSTAAIQQIADEQAEDAAEQIARAWS